MRVIRSMRGPGPLRGMPGTGSAGVRSELAAVLQVGVVVAAVGMLGLAGHQPWLFPSLGPTAIMQAQTPLHPSAKAWNAAVGHGCAVLLGWLSVVALGAQGAPAVLASGQLTGIRMAAAAVAVTLTALAMAALRAEHPPAAATTLLFAEGSYHPDAHDILLVAAGLALTVAMGEVLRRARDPGREV